MYATRLFHLLLLAVFVVCLAQSALSAPSQEDPHALVERQNTADETSSAADQPTQDPTTAEETSAAPTEDPTTSEAAPETTSSSSDVETSQPPETTTSSEQEPTSVPATTTSSEPEQTEASTSDPPTTSAPEQTSSTKKDDDKSSISTTESLSVATSVVVQTRTNDDGSRETMTSTSLTTHTPGLNEDNSDDDSSGMAPKTRNTIIGVVVGIGGAIVIGALAVVAWRIWGRKKHTEESDTLMTEYSGNGPEKAPNSSAGASNSAQRSPFQSTLDTYHQPTAVNASSNF